MFYGIATVKIVSVHSGKVLDVYAFGQEKETPIVQHDYLGGDNQHWLISSSTDSGEMLYEIRAMHSDFILDGMLNGVNGTPVFQFLGTQEKQLYPRWLIEPVQGRPDIFLIRYAANSKVLDVWLKGLQNGAPIVLHDYLGGDNQHWQFVLVSKE